MTDAGDMVAKESTEAAMVYLEKSNGAKVAEKSFVEVKGSDGYVTVEKGLNLNMRIKRYYIGVLILVCGELDSLLDLGTPPDLVLDLTKNGISSEAIKLLSLSLGLPTVSAAFGEEGDIRFASTFLQMIE